MAIKLQEYSADKADASRWDDWMASQNAADFQHYYSYGQAMAVRNTQLTYLEFSDAIGIAARAVAFRQRIGPVSILYLPRGLVFAQGSDRHGVYGCVKKMGKALRGRFVILSLSDLADAAILSGHAVMTGQTDAVISLLADDASFKAQMHQKWRNRLHKALASPLKIKRYGVNHSDVQWLIEAESAQRKKMEYRALPADLPASMAQHKGKTQALYVIAKQAGQPVSGAAFIVNGAEAFYFSGVNKGAGRTVCGQHLILYKAATMLREMGCKRLNLGAIDTHNSPGLARFKLGVGAKAQLRGGTYIFG